MSLNSAPKERVRQMMMNQALNEADRLVQSIIKEHGNHLMTGSFILIALDNWKKAGIQTFVGMSHQIGLSIKEIEDLINEATSITINKYIG